MLSRKQSYESIKERLEYLQLSISNSGSLNLNDLAIHAENFFRDLLNLVYGWQLENANTGNQNAADIDLQDTGQDIFIQVTAQNNRAKIAGTLKSFHSKTENSGHRLKFMLISKGALKYKAFTGYEDRFDATEDIIDLKKLLREINDLSTRMMDEIAKFLEKEVSIGGKNEERDSVISTSANVTDRGIFIQNPQGPIYLGTAPETESSKVEDQRSKSGFQKFYPAPFIPDLKYFVGREELLGNLKSTLQTHHKASIHDISGLGKTFACYKFAADNQDNYSKIFFVNCAKEAMMGSLASLGQMLNPGIEESPQEEQAMAFKNWLETTKGWLVIYDNVDEPAALAPFVPNNINGDSLFTSNDPQIRNLGDEVSIGKLETKNAAVLLFRRSIANTSAQIAFTGDSEQTAFWQIVEDLDGLPVALNTTGAFIEQQGISYSEYLENLEAFPNLNLEHGDEFDPYKKTILKAFALAIDANTNVKDKFIGKAVDELYRAASLIGPDDIPEEFLRSVLEKNNEEFAALAEQNILWQKIRKHLQGFDLFKYDSLAKSFSTHRLIQKCIQSRLGDAKIEYCEKVLNILYESFPLYDYNNKAECERFYQHVLTALENAGKAGFEANVSGALFFRTGSYQEDIGNYRQAVEFYQRNLEISLRVYGEEHEQTAASLNNLAEVYRAQGKYDDAIKLYEQAIEIEEKTIGKEHPDYAKALNNFGKVYKTQGKYNKAIKLFKQAIRIKELILGSGHVSTATSYNELANVYQNIEKYGDAIPLFEKVIETYKGNLGTGHPWVATALNNLAVTYFKTETYSEALPLFKEALRIWEAKLPLEHPNIANVKVSIEICEEMLGQG